MCCQAAVILHFWGCIQIPLIMVYHGRTQPKIAGGGGVRGSEGHPADDDDLASEKGHLLAKRALFPTNTGGGGGC